MESPGGGANDNSFGPQFGSHFDFTLLFEQTIFTVLPATIFIALFPCCIWYCCRNPTPIRTSPLLWTKLLVAVALVGVDFAALALWSSSTAVRISITMTASVLSCLANICVAIVVYFRHRQAIRSSPLITIYLTFGTILDAVKAQSYFARERMEAFGYVAVATAALKCVLMALEEIPKRNLIVESQVRENIGAEAVGGFWNRSLFLWVNRILLNGFRKVMTNDDLESLGPELQSSHLFTKFNSKWTRANKDSSYCLLKTCMIVFYQQILLVIIPRLFFTALSFSQPLFLRRIVVYVGQEHTSDTATGRGLIGASVLIFAGMAITKAIYTHMNNRLIVSLRGALVSQVIRKTLSVRQVKAMESAAVTLMSTDIEGLIIGYPHFHESWLNVIEVGLGMFLLTTVVGWVSCLYLVPVAISVVVIVYVSRYTGPAQEAWNEKIQHRVSKTSNMLSQMKNLKVLALEGLTGHYIQGLRMFELELFKKFRFYNIITTITAVFADLCGPVIVLAGAIFLTEASEKVSAADTFTTLMVVALIVEPLGNVISASRQIPSTIACLKRIQQFLLQDEVHDALKLNEVSTNIRISGCSEKNNYQVQTIELGPHRRPQVMLESLIQFSNVTLAVSDGTKELLRNVSFTITAAETTVVLGPTGCGKTTLLRAMLGDADCLTGSIQYCQNTIAYCSQTPWIRNVSIRDNIVGESVFDPVFYEVVLSQCELNQDLEQFIGGDQKLAGNDGVNLSGGQRHRIALARALYSRTPILILDDIFSALDSVTGHRLFRNLFRPAGLLRSLNYTVVLATHSTEYIEIANQTILLDNWGNVQVTSTMSRAQLPPEYVASLTLQEGAPPVEEERSIEISRQQPLNTADESNLLYIRQSGDFSLYAYYFRSVRPWLAAFFAMLLIMSGVLDAVPAIFVRIWLDVAPENKLWFLGYAMLAGSGVFCTGVMMVLFFNKIIPYSADNLHQQLMASLIGFSQDISLLSQELPTALLLFIIYFVHLIIDTGVVAAGASYMAAIIPLILFVVYGVQFFYLRTSRQMRHLELEAKTPLYTQLTEMAKGLDHIRCFGWQHMTLQKSLVLLDTSQKPFYYLFTIQRWLTLVLDLLILVLAVTLISVAVLVKGRTSQAGIGLSLLVLSQYTNGLAQLIEKWTTLETSLGAIARIKAFAELTPQEEVSKDLFVPRDWPREGVIEFTAVNSKYRTDGPNALSDISFRTQGGEKVALVGRTGGGKSTLLLTLLNFLDYTGSITLDGVELSTIPRYYLRGQLITTISQDAVELEGSVRYNLLPHERQREGSLYDSTLYYYVGKLGLEAVIQERGGVERPLSSMRLSKGQMQLLCIVRAILHHIYTGSKIILMDEATSSLDHQLDAEVQDIMNEAFDGCTMIVVAHRLETVEDADTFMEFYNGRIISIDY